MDTFTTETSPALELEAYLTKACEAEARGDPVEAERLFACALRCEALPQSNVGNVSE
jgi:hypothetical protein